MHATPQQVWDVLADGWLYPLWVVGATRMREVDEDWPAVGSQLHHSVGTWPLMLDDSTEVLECSPGRGWCSRRAPGRPARRRCVLHLSPVGAETEVTIEEDVLEGPGQLMPKPLRDAQLHWRNDEALQRLAFVVERRDKD